MNGVVIMIIRDDQLTPVHKSIHRQQPCLALVDYPRGPSHVQLFQSENIPSMSYRIKLCLLLPSSSSLYLTTKRAAKMSYYTNLPVPVSNRPHGILYEYLL